MNNVSRLAVVIVIGVALIAPALLISLGYEPAEVENRTRTPLPAVSLQRVSDAEFFSDLDRYLEDRTVGRPELIEADAWIDYEVFNDSPSLEVVTGTGGWLYYRLALTKLCDSPQHDAHMSADAFRETAELLAKAGRPLLWAVAPNKATIYPEFLTGRGAAMATCSNRERDVFLSEAASIGGYVDILEALHRAAADSDIPIYHPHDTHWNQLGVAVLVEKLLATLDRPIDVELVPTGFTLHEGDLTRLMGLPFRLEAPVVSIPAPDVTTTVVEQNEGGLAPIRTYRSVPSDQLVHGRTLVIHDSFMNPALSSLPAFFEEAVFIHWNHYDPELFAELVMSSDRVLIEIVERGVFERLGAQFGSVEFRAAIESRLAERDQ